MIVHKGSKSYETRSDKPNENWGYENVFVVPDGSELANKIIEHAPHFEFVIDENGDLIDIKPTEKPPAPPPEPSETELLVEYLLDVDFRVAMLELGLI